ncbi:MAG: site-specific DNA-methyltransferase [Anaerolineae bacterium]|nr:site-specific DNA-methyltransferase [Anaerolineae bacterium]
MATSESKKQWNGKLPDDFADTGDDAFNITLSYPGKKTVNEILETERPLVQKLWQDIDAPRNHFYYGDNLKLLANLLDNPEIKGKVRLIYIDPPFSTNGIFKSRSRNDAYQDLLKGAEFIEFLRQRLILLRELLADDGSIYIHLDANMVFHIKVIMDELFGKKHFRSLITRRKCNPKNYTRNSYGNISDYLLFYTKSDQYIWNRPLEAWTSEKLDQEYQYIEKETGRRYKKVPVHAPGERKGATGKSWRGKMPPPGKHWQYTPDTLDEMDKRGEIYWSPTGNPRRKIYSDQTKGIPIQDIWLDMRDAHNQNIKITGYPTEKPPAMLARIIQASSNPGDIVLDCFSGSGTTLVEASRLERPWLGMDNSLEAVMTMLKRFQGGLELMGDYVTPDTKKGVQLSLPFVHDPLIRDFALSTLEPYQGDLDHILMSWHKLSI